MVWHSLLPDKQHLLNGFTDGIPYFQLLCVWVQSCKGRCHPYWIISYRFGVLGYRIQNFVSGGEFIPCYLSTHGFSCHQVLWEVHVSFFMMSSVTEYTFFTAISSAYGKSVWRTCSLSSSWIVVFSMLAVYLGGFLYWRTLLPEATINRRCLSFVGCVLPGPLAREDLATRMTYGFRPISVLCTW